MTPDNGAVGDNRICRVDTRWKIRVVSVDAFSRQQERFAQPGKFQAVPFFTDFPCRCRTAAANNILVVRPAERQTAEQGKIFRYRGDENSGVKCFLIVVIPFLIQ